MDRYVSEFALPASVSDTTPLWEVIHRGGLWIFVTPLLDPHLSRLNIL